MPIYCDLESPTQLTNSCRMLWECVFSSEVAQNLLRSFICLLMGEARGSGEKQKGGEGHKTFQEMSLTEDFRVQGQVWRFLDLFLPRKLEANQISVFSHF